MKPLLLDNHSELEIVYRSKDYAVLPKRSLRFRLQMIKALTFSVHMETDDPAARQLAQLRFAEYFDFCRERNCCRKEMPLNSGIALTENKFR